MATRVTSTKGSPEAKTRVGGGPGFPGPNGKGPRGNGWHGGEDPDRRSPSIYRVTMWVVLAAIVMTFAALSMVYIYLNVTASDRARPVSMPRMFYLSSCIILISSFSLEHSRRSLKRAAQSASVKWLGLTLALGIVFLACQLFGWRELAAQGVFFAGNPHSSFFYLFTGVHGVHLLGGIGALLYLFVRMRRNRAPLSEKTEVAAQVVSLYWHTMDGLWIWLFLLLWFWK